MLAKLYFVPNSKNIPFPSLSLRLGSAIASLSNCNACKWPNSAAFIKGLRPFNNKKNN